MKETGILMLPDLALATRKSRKTMTRRTVKPEPHTPPAGYPFKFYKAEFGQLTEIHCPYGGPGDRLYIKEPFQITQRGLALDGSKRVQVNGLYTDDKAPFSVFLTEEESAKLMLWKQWFKGKSPFFMFKSLARTWMEVTAVRGERVRAITEEDAKAEGAEPIMVQFKDGSGECAESYVGGFAQLWDKIHGAGAWYRNDYVWVVSYNLIPKP